MKKILIGIALAIVLVVVLFFALNSYIYNEKQGDTGVQPTYKDITYTIEGQPVTLTNGFSEVETAPDSTGSPQAGSASKIVTKYFGNYAEGDVNEDGVSDIAFLLTQTTGGSGTFYYVVVALKTDTGYTGTNAVLLGDRIAPQTTEIRDGEVIVNYAERKPDEPMTASPSMGVSKYLQVSGTTLVEIKK